MYVKEVNIMKIKENIIGWWYTNDTIFNFSVEISFFHFLFLIKIFTFELKIELTLPYFFNYYKNIFFKYIGITKNKTGEIELLFTNNLVMGILFYKNTHCDHASMHLEISLLGLAVIFTIYDNRHWDYENNEYEKYEEHSNRI
jgi:hypothetical protein